MSIARKQIKQSFLKQLVALALMGLGQSLAAHAASTEDERVNALEKKLDDSVAVIQALSKRVHELESQLGPAQGAPAAAQPPPPPATTTAPPDAAAAQAQTNTEQRLDALQQQVTQMAASAAQPNNNAGMPMHGFADVGFGNHNAQFPQYKGFDIAELDFYLTPDLGPRTRALFELNFEVGQDGEVGVDLERAQIGYQFSEGATVWFGRFHTPFGYYNTAFHHGQEIATSLRRPGFLEFEDHGGVFPAHTVGSWLTGAERVGDSKVTYDVFVGNSQRISDGTVDMNNAGNTNGKPIYGGNLGFLPGGVLEGLKIGLSAFQARSIDDQDVTPNVYTRVTNYGTYAVYDTDYWEVIGEAYIFDNYDLTNHTGRHHSDAGFIQWGYRDGRYTPYIRYERAALQQSDPYFAAQLNGQSYYRDAAGVRFDIDLKSALKLEIANTQITDRRRGDFGEALVQYAIRF